jgi:hypothetical protein
MVNVPSEANHLAASPGILTDANRILTAPVLDTPGAVAFLCGTCGHVKRRFRHSGAAAKGRDAAASKTVDSLVIGGLHLSQRILVVRNPSQASPMTEPLKRQAPSRGRCAFCNKTAAKSGMRRHLDSCDARAAAQVRSKRASSGPSLHLTVEGDENPAYWLHLEAGASATLEALDRYLRRLWLECCGHLSAFEIDGIRDAAVPDDEWGEEEESMTKRLSRVLRPGEACGYEYDYGSTTQLRVRVWGEVPERSGREGIVLLARNEPPDLPCVDCGRSPAVRACAVCRYETGGWLCAKCARKHECGEDMQLPIVNSPRTGVCGYTGD